MVWQQVYSVLVLGKTNKQTVVHKTDWLYQVEVTATPTKMAYHCQQQ